MSDPLRLLILGAHPDDPEFAAGGLATIYAGAGHVVKMVSVTNGESGHHERFGPQLIETRRAEAAASAQVIGADSDVWEFRDGYLEPTLDVRFRIIAELRRFRPDLVLTHRPNDYHPDHRAVGQAVQDASYMVTVPAIVPEVPILRRDPIVGYLPDGFSKPTPLEPHVVVDTTAQFDTIVQMLACHASQVFAWLPYNHGQADGMPAEADARLEWLADWYGERAATRVKRFRAALEQTYGKEHAERCRAAEAFEISEYAAPLDQAARRRLFWFLP